MENTAIHPLNVYFHPDNLKLAYFRVRCWPERLVKDRLGIQAFGAELDKNLQALSEKLLTGAYKPQAGFKFYEPKSSGTQRTKTLLMIEDALVYQAIANIIAQRVYPELEKNNAFIFGSVLTPEVAKGTELLNEEEPNYFFFQFWKSLFGRFKDSVIKAIEEDKASYKFETDITGFFDSIPHYNLLLTLSQEFQVEDEVLDLLSDCLNIWSGTRANSTPGVGIPQGPQPSFFFANLLLHPLDREVIKEGMKYYRYMDDIKIYGYEEDEMLDVLVLIDNYLKGHGLSINSKKTSIEKVDATKEDKTVKELRRFKVIAQEYDGKFIPVEKEKPKEKEDFFELKLSALMDQGSGSFGDLLNIEVITDPEEVRKFWLEEIRSVEEELPTLFKNDSIELANPEETDDIDFIRISAKYGTALRELNREKASAIAANPKLLDYFLFALKKYFWRAGIMVITLQHYSEDPKLKKTLRSYYEWGKNYEWYRYHIITCLAYNFKYTDKELREYFKVLKDEPSELVRYALYCMIIRHSRDQQLLRSVKHFSSLEKSWYLKAMVVAFWRRDEYRTENMEDLINAVGL